MSSRWKYARFRTQSSHQTEESIEKINLVIFDVNPNHFIINDQRFQVKVFSEEEVDLWFDYITIGLKNIYLFIANIISNIFFQLICEYPQIKSIYIFCKDEQYKNYSNLESKLRGIFNDFDTMFKQFQDDITKPMDQSFSEQSTLKDIDSEYAKRLWWRFFDRILRHLRPTNIAKDEMKAFFRNYFRDDEYELKNINTFETNYTSDRAIYWYNKYTFLSSFLNQAFRTQMKLNILFKLRSILTDLISGLKAAQLDSHDTIHPLTLYRGQHMSINDIQQIKSAIGTVLLINNLLSTTMDKQVAQVFAETSFDTPSEMTGVLFVFEIDSLLINSETIPYANISNYSYYDHNEGEVLFWNNPTFRIQSVELNENNIWYINLKLVDDPSSIEFGERSIFSPHADEIYLRNLSTENKQFVTFRLLLDIILRLDQNEYAKKELIEFLRSKYQHESIELEEIDDFENNYQSEDAAKWYTKNSFFISFIK